MKNRTELTLYAIRNYLDAHFATYLGTISTEMNDGLELPAITPTLIGYRNPLTLPRFPTQMLFRDKRDRIIDPVEVPLYFDVIQAVTYPDAETLEKMSSRYSDALFNLIEESGLPGICDEAWIEDADWYAQDLRERSLLVSVVIIGVNVQTDSAYLTG